LEYRKSFLLGQIDFISFIGPMCPICGEKHCYRGITPYRRHAIDLFPEYKKERIPVARFLCRRSGKTFSLLPIQLIPYFQYTVHAVIGALVLGLKLWESGQRGFYGASLEVDPESRVTPWLIAYWSMVVIRGFQHAHATLMGWYDLSGIRSQEGLGGWEEAAGYFFCFGWKEKIVRWDLLQAPVTRYSRQTKRFIFGTPSQLRIREGPLSRGTIPT
jgi:hypothetical protein